MAEQTVLPAFEATGVCYGYQDVPAIRDLTMTISRGRRIAVLGANGSGKSTLLRLLDGLYFPDKGQITAFGEILSEARLADDAVAFAFRRRVGLVFQNPDVQLFCPTVFDEVAFGPLQLGWAKEEILAKIEKALSDFSLGHLRNRPPHRLSGGEKKRVALASVLVLDPEILLLDEPTAALDPPSQGDVVSFLAGQRGSSRTIVTATHDLDIVPDIADYCFVMQAGTVVAEGTPADILADMDLLRRTGIIHAHRHVHPDGTAHIHPHLHHEHSHRKD
jgi:cobalt/nickel transport system ATP-binding protein